MAAQGIEPTKLHMAVGYLDTYLELDESETLQLREGMDEVGLSSESSIMEFLTNVEKDALVRGREEGREEKGEESRMQLITRIRDGLMDWANTKSN